MGEDSLRERVSLLETENAALRAQLGISGEAPLGRGLSKREALLVEAERVAHLGSWAWDLASGEIEWSEELYRILGLSAARTKPTADAFYDAIHPDDRARVQELSTRSLAGEHAQSVEFRVRRPSGELRTVRMEGAILHDAQGKQTHVVGSVLDLTESRNVAALLSRTIEELADAQRVARMGSYTWDIKSGILRWSPGMYELFGLRGDETPDEKLFFAHVHPDDAEQVARARDEALSSQTSREQEFRIVARHGAVLDVVMESRAQLDSDGQLLGFRGVIQDITRRKLFEEQLRQSQKMEAVGTLAGGVAHDFNNYLMVISAQAELLRFSLEPNHQGQAAIEAIQTACGRCAALTSQLLTLSRKREATPQHVDLGALLARIAPMARSVLSEASELVIVTKEPNAFVYVDPGQLEQAIMNLVVNARDAMTPKGGRLTLTVERAVDRGADGPDGEGGSNCKRRAARDPADAKKARSFSIRLSASDTGAGIAPEHCARIFEPFFTTKGVGRGTGLGLTTTYGIVKQAGGSIEVDSKLGSGTTFRIDLPSSEASPSAPPAAREASTSGNGHGRTVLLVEDLAEVRTVLQRQLEQGGYRVLTASHGHAALELLASATDPVDAVLTDVVMPGMGGLELERKLHERYPGTPCILMTGYAEAALGTGDASRIALRKPFSSHELHDALEHAWQRKR